MITEETVTPAAATEPATQEKSVEDILAEIDADFAAEAAAEPDTQVKSATGSEQKAEVKSPEGNDQAKALLKAHQRLAQREAELARKEAQLRTSTRPEEANKSGKTWTKAHIQADLVGYFKELGIDPSIAARAMIAQDLGDNSPKEYRDMADRLRQEGSVGAEIEALRRENAELRSDFNRGVQERSVQELQQEYHRQVETSLSGDLNETPVVAAMVSKVPL